MVAAGWIVEMETSTQYRSDLAEIRSWWRGELAAVETYAQAIEFVRDNPLLRTTLQQAQVSHQRRCSCLEKEIRALGAKPDGSSGVWGEFARLVEGGAQLLGVRSAIAALEEGETHGLRVYQDAVDSNLLSRRVRNFVACDLLQEQRATTNRITQLMRATSNPPSERGAYPDASRRGSNAESMRESRP